MISMEEWLQSQRVKDYFLVHVNAMFQSLKLILYVLWVTITKWNDIIMQGKQLLVLAEWIGEYKMVKGTRKHGVLFGFF